MEKYSLEELKLLTEWIKQQKSAPMRNIGRNWGCPTVLRARICIQKKKIVLLIVRGNGYDLY